jgi:GT2 family glycosyltransferase
MLITASIVLFKNPKDIVQHVINSFLNSSLNLHLYLIDNSPTDNLRGCFSDIRITYFHNPSNPGFGASHNLAIKKSIDLNSNYHLVLNPDIYFNSGSLENIISFMESHPEIGHLMPKILYPNGDFQYLCKTNPTFFDLFARGFMPQFLKKFFNRRLDKYEYRSNNFNEIIYDIPYLSGCFMFFRTNTLKKVGFFDEKIFMYLEDADITRRFLNYSRTVYYPFATVYHHYAGLTHKSWKYKWITIKSAFTYFNKWGWLKSII